MPNVATLISRGYSRDPAATRALLVRYLDIDPWRLGPKTLKDWLDKQPMKSGGPPSVWDLLGE